MDLHLRGVEPTASERAAVDALLGPPSEHRTASRREGGHEARSRRHLLLPALHAVNDAVGWISEGALEYLCSRLTVPPAEAYGVATFYAMFSVTSRPPRVAHVCEDLACRANGADAVMETLEAELGPAGHPDDEDAVATWERSPCLGLCERAPAVWLQRAGQADAVSAPADLDAVRGGLSGMDLPEAPPVSRSAPQVVDDSANGHGAVLVPEGGLRLLSRVGRHDPRSLDAYRSVGGYQALRRALRLGAEGVLRELDESGLAGRGGAAFPLGVKWKGVATAPTRPHYVVANADESEPGTFKDRVLMEHDPFALVEAMTVAGLATSSERGYIYLRGEYPVALARLEEAIAQCRARGLLGDDVMGEGVTFDLEVRRGAGAYICGEETALLESLEGKRGEPRQKPPFPTQAGLFGKPTAINNVETLTAVLDVLAVGGPAYRRIGTDRSTGTKLFCVSGSVARPGVYEVAFGATAGDLLELAGGVPDGRALQAVLLGGAAGTFLRPDQLDVPLTFEGARAAGQALGSGVVMAFDDTVDLMAMLGQVAAFFRDESCGQCVPCRVGTVRQEEALARLAGGSDPAAELPLLEELSQVMVDASICGLGHTAPSALQSALAQGLLPGLDQATAAVRVQEEERG